MVRALMTVVVILLLGLACRHYREEPVPAEVFARPLSSHGLATCLDALRSAGVDCQVDPSGSGLLVAPALLEKARQELAQKALPAIDSETTEVTETPVELRETLGRLAGVRAASVRTSASEALVMLDLEYRPTHDFLTEVSETVTASHPTITLENVKIVDSQCRDWSRQTDAGTKIPRERQVERLNQQIEQRLQQDLDAALGWGKAHAEVSLTWQENFTTRYALPRPEDAHRPSLQLEVKLLLAPVNAMQRSLALHKVDQLKQAWKLKESRGDVFRVKEAIWSARQRPLSRGELEQLKAGLVSPPPPREKPWVGLPLLGLALTLWGMLCGRLLQRHRFLRS